MEWELDICPPDELTGLRWATLGHAGQVAGEVRLVQQWCSTALFSDGCAVRNAVWERGNRPLNRPPSRSASWASSYLTLAACNCSVGTLHGYLVGTNLGVLRMWLEWGQSGSSFPFKAMGF